MSNRISSKQDAALTFIATNPGCTAADVCRSEWCGRGHAASYARVERLVRRGFVERVRSGAAYKLYLSESAPRSDCKAF